ncbi:hypothetical protein POTOM_031072 [Populus tomentosa]|uniref:PsbP C-terminal domain-containing protein n=1 Tax=Populus tomentosa TaxID=118781 RepID=A0A8X8CI75_POPTO|nr:hypothetical protein POTOM_031072 [Populus tomentosa]
MLDITLWVSCLRVQVGVQNSPWNVLSVEEAFLFLLGLSSRQRLQLLILKEVVIEGQDKVFKDVIEPLESVSVNMIPTVKQDLRDNGPPQQVFHVYFIPEAVAETLIKKVSAPPSQKTKLVEAKEHDADGKVYYAIESVAQAPNFTCHALSAITIGNGIIDLATITFSFILFNFSHLYSVLSHLPSGQVSMFIMMKDKLQTVVDSFEIFNV